MRIIICIILILYCHNTVNSMALLKGPFSIGDSVDSDVLEILSDKKYFPNEDSLPKISISNNIDNDATYILSKLTDDVLIKLLNQQPKKDEYDLNDVLNIVGVAKEENNVFKDITKPMSDKPQNHYESLGAFFRLEDKEVQPYNYKESVDSKHNAIQKLNNILYSLPQDDNVDSDDKRKELLFNVLVSQLKALCCKPKPKTNKNVRQLQNVMKNTISSQKALSQLLQQPVENPREQLFLIVNDEIKSDDSGDSLVAVDPDTLAANSSVLLLGPINTPLSDGELSLVMTRIGNELSKPEYSPLLQRLSEGAVDEISQGLSRSLLTGPDSRRYIKPHRCNHQSKLSKVYGGTKWLICTGYLNLNTPSVYD